MGLCHIVLVIGIALLIDTLSTGIFAEVDATSSYLTASIVSGNNMTGERSLRVNTRDEAGGNVDNTYEARTGNLISKVSDFLKRDNVIRWAEAGKTDDFVKEKLKLNGLSGNALIQHKNYQYFENFVMFKRSNQLTAWQTTDTPTYAVWRELGLGNVNTWDDLMNAVDTDAFKLYQRYVDSFDNNAIIKAAFEHKPIPVLLSSETSWTERVARMVSWKINNKPEAYVMKALGFDKLSPAALEANENGKTFLVYWLLKHDNSLNADQQNTMGIVKKLKELENLSPSNLTKMKNSDSLDTPQQKTKVLFKKLLELEDLPRVQLVASDKYQTYKYLYGLIKQDKIDEYTSTLRERLAPRL